MKKNRKYKKLASILVALVCVLGSQTFTTSAQAQSGETSEKIRLMSAALRARDAGELDAAKANLEELIKLAPNDAQVAQMLSAVNADIERRNAGQTPVYGQAAEIQDFSPAGAAASSSSLDSMLAAKSSAQADMIADAKSSIKAARDLAKVGRYDDATSTLLAAKEALPLNVSTVKRVEAIDETLAAVYSAQIDEALSAGNFSQAKSLQEAFLDVGGSEESAAMFADVIRAAELNPYAQNVEAASPGFIDEQREIESLTAKAKAQYYYGDLVGATRTLTEIEKRDPYNVEVKAIQKRVAEKRNESGAWDRERTREEMLGEVGRQWQRPAVFEQRPVEAVEATGSALLEKLRDIRIPRVQFSGMPLSRVVETLSELSTEYDTGTTEVTKKGVNIVLYSQGADPNVTITLRNLSLDKILDFVTRSVNYSWEASDEVVTILRSEGSFLETEFFPLRRDVLLRITGGGGDTGGGAPAAAADPFAPAPAAAPLGGGGGADETDEKIKSFLERAGVPFIDGASLVYDGAQLIVTQSSRNLEKVRNILRRYDQPKQVEIETRFLDVQQGNLAELGVDWAVSRGSKGFSTSNRTLADAFTINQEEAQISIQAPQLSGDFVIVETGADTTAIARDTNGDFIRNPGLDAVDFAQGILPPQIPNTIDFAQGAASLINWSGIISGAQTQFILRALERDTGTDLLSSPRVTVLSGRTAQIVVAQELRYPESYSDIESEVGNSGSVLGGGSGGVTITAGTPEDFTTRNVGVEMEVTPTVEENQNISLKLEPRVTEFEGFVEYGGPSVALSFGTTVTVPAGFYQPVFSVRSVRTEVTVYDGATVVLGGLTREEVKTVSDKVPVLGDIPLLGNFFKSKGETSQKRNLMIFVTANMISPGGSLSRRSVEDVEADTTFSSPTIITPGGAVNRRVVAPAAPVPGQ